MTKLNEIYRCNVCGNIVQMIHEGIGTLVCCGQPMELLKEQIKELGFEKHVPVIEKTSDGVKVKVGAVPHPMEAKHYIEWIEIVADGKVYRKFLKPGDVPEAEFCISAKKITAREYCSVHRLWKSK
jgi:superoxide reductase